MVIWNWISSLTDDINLELLLSVVNRVSFRFVLRSLVGVMMILNFFSF